MWAKAGRELRHMADIFAQTSERRRVKQKAAEVTFFFFFFFYMIYVSKVYFLELLVLVEIEH